MYLLGRRRQGVCSARLGRRDLVGREVVDGVGLGGGSVAHGDELAEK